MQRSLTIHNQIQTSKGLKLTGKIASVLLLQAIARTSTIGIQNSLNIPLKFGRTGIKIQLIKLNGILLDAFLLVVVVQRARSVYGSQSNHSLHTFLMILEKKSIQSNGATYPMATFCQQQEVKLGLLLFGMSMSGNYCLNCNRMIKSRVACIVWLSVRIIK